MVHRNRIFRSSIAFLLTFILLISGIPIPHLIYDDTDIPQLTVKSIGMQEVLADMWDGQGGNGSNPSGGSGPFIGWQAIQYTVIDKDSGDTIGVPVIFAHHTQKAGILSEGAVARYASASKLSYMYGMSNFPGTPNLAVLPSTLYVPDQSNQNYYNLLTHKYIYGNPGAVAQIQREVENSTIGSGGFMDYLAENLKEAANATGASGAASQMEAVFAAKNYNILIEPMGLWKNISGNGYPSKMLITTAEMGLIQNHRGAPWDTHQGNQIFSTLAPAAATSQARSLYLAETHEFNGGSRLLRPYNSNGQLTSNSFPSPLQTVPHLRTHQSNNGRAVEHHPNIVLLDIMGIAIIKPSGSPLPINIIATDLEVEYLADTHQIKVKAGYAMDARAPYEDMGFDSQSLRTTPESNRYGNMSEASTGTNGLPNYLPGLTNVALNMHWTKNGAYNTSATIRNTDYTDYDGRGIPLYIENAVQFANPSERAQDISAFGEYIEDASIQQSYSGIFGEKYWLTLDGQTNDLQRPEMAQAVSQEGEYLIFDLPPKPAGATGLIVWSRVNNNLYWNSPVMNEQGTTGLTRPIVDRLY